MITAWLSRLSGASHMWTREGGKKGLLRARVLAAALLMPLSASRSPTRLPVERLVPPDSCMTFRQTTFIKVLVIFTLTKGEYAKI